MFFVVDVETNSVDTAWAEILSIGAVATDGKEEKGRFYARLEWSGIWQEDTLQWWQEIPVEDARAEIFDEGLDRHTPAYAAVEFVEWVTCWDSPRYFVANPVSFDKPIVDRWLHNQEYGIATTQYPFHYRSLCLRSMKYGMRANSEFDSERDNHEPKIPHHALYDAEAQTEDFHALLKERDFRALDLEKISTRAILLELCRRGDEELLFKQEGKELAFGARNILSQFANPFLDQARYGNPSQPTS